MSLFSRKKPSPAPAPGPVSVTGGPTIAYINLTSALKDSEIAPVIQALQLQVSQHFGPAWDLNATLVQVPAGGTPPAGSWHMYLLDNSDTAGALGLHDITAEGLPLGKCFVKTTMDAGDAWTVCLSHETLEQLADPTINKVFQVGDSEFWAAEVSDTCEADQYGYQVNGILLSDWVYPAWFGGPSDGRFDYMGHVKHALEILPGGYIGAWTPNTGWGIRTNKTADQKTLVSSRAPVGSRRERRSVPRSQWTRSTYKF